MPADLTAARSRVMEALKRIADALAFVPAIESDEDRADTEIDRAVKALGWQYAEISALLTAGPMTGAEAAAIALRLLDRWNNDRAVIPSWSATKALKVDVVQSVTVSVQTDKSAFALADAILAANRSGYLAGLAREAEMEFEIAALRSTIEQLSQPPGTVTTA